MNPAMATGHSYGCEDIRVGHVIVYTLGPVIGCYLASTFDWYLHIDVTGKSARGSRCHQFLITDAKDS